MNRNQMTPYRNLKALKFTLDLTMTCTSIGMSLWMVLAGTGAEDRIQNSKLTTPDTLSNTGIITGTYM